MVLDLYIFNLITDTLKNSVFDFLMPVLSDSKLWRLPLLMTMSAILFYKKRRGLEVLIICFIAVALSDFISGAVLKPLIGRPRPLGGITHSFPSSHASNMFAASLVMVYYWRKSWVYAVSYTASFFVAYSRIYTTSHYPSDVIAGAVLGTVIAYSVIKGYGYIIRKYKKKALKLNGKNT